MKVQFYATLRQVVGAKTVEVPVPPGSTLQTLVDTVVVQYPDMRSMLLDADGDLLGNVHVFLNGRDGHYLAQGMETVVAATDVVDIFPAVGGG
ncbi:MAG: ubiquitin-like small modifier protein 1 [Anaerolineae bacterium]